MKKIYIVTSNTVKTEAVFDTAKQAEEFAEKENNIFGKRYYIHEHERREDSHVNKRTTRDSKQGDRL